MRAPASGSAANMRTGRRIRTTRNACPQRTERGAETADDRPRPRPPKPLTGVQAMMTHRTGSPTDLAQQMPGNTSETLTNPLRQRWLLINPAILPPLSSEALGPSLQKRSDLAPEKRIPFLLVQCKQGKRK